MRDGEEEGREAAKAWGEQKVRLTSEMCAWHCCKPKLYHLRAERSLANYITFLILVPLL